ncbi:MAG: EamA family transporter [Bacteroidia bacterium]
MNSNSKAWLAFWGVAIFWGTTFLAIKIAIQSFQPFLLAAFRHTIAGTTLLIYFLLRGYKLPPIKNLKIFALNGVLMFAMGNGIISWGMLYVDSGLAALLSALTPVWIVIINNLYGKKEYSGPLVILGFVMCLAGQVFIFINHGGNLSNIKFLWGLLAVFVSNICWAFGTIYSKNHQIQIHPLFGASLQMIPGGIVCAMIAFLLGDFKSFNPNIDAIISLFYLVLFGSILAYGCYMYIIKRMPATIVGTYAYINTMVAVIIGWLWLNETLSFLIIVAMIFTIAGVFLINYSLQKQ